MAASALALAREEGGHAWSAVLHGHRLGLAPLSGEKPPEEGEVIMAIETPTRADSGPYHP